MVDDCLFCKMIDGEIAADIVHQDEDVFAFKDINPQAPHHVLIVPKRHIATLNDLAENDHALVGKVTLAAKKIAVDLGIAETGYRTVFNCNADAGQAVFHIHLHLLGGRRMSWPPG
jgi:histidine triad (HIT) family protein|tara:strand:- start:11469 stop:11816 length:348 start_codon:yes stop_codon:yes gene_type:complete